MLAPAAERSLRLAAVPGLVRAGAAELIAHSFDGTFQQQLPDLVIEATGAEQVARVLQAAVAHRVPVMPRGAATSLAGGAVPLDGGVVLDLGRLDRILAIDGADGVVVCQPGVLNGDLQAAVEAAGWFYPPDPASLRQCTIGGNVATNAGGPRCLKYGTTREYVTGLEVVLTSGAVLRLGGRMLKNASGYQLLQLFVGSEGTLGVVTEITLRLLPLPSAAATAAAFFPSLEAAGAAVGAVLATGVRPAALEILDGATLAVVERFAGLGLPAAEALLILEQDGNDPAACMADVRRMVAACWTAGASDVQLAEGPAERAALWRARQAAGGAVGQLAPDKISEDIVVPRSQLVPLIRRIEAIAAETGLAIPTWGHAGDGNLHPAILFDRTRPGELERVEAAAGAIFLAAIELGGTLSGEHGIGSLKREFLEAAVGSAALEQMRALKRLFDPAGILNPGKVFPRGTQAGFLTALPTLTDGGAGPGP